MLFQGVFILCDYMSAPISVRMSLHIWMQMTWQSKFKGAFRTSSTAIALCLYQGEKSILGKKILTAVSCFHLYNPSPMIMKSKNEKDQQEVYSVSSHQLQSKVHHEIQSKILDMFLKRHITHRPLFVLLIILAAAVPLIWLASTLFSISEHAGSRPNTENQISWVTYAATAAKKLYFPNH